MYEAEEAVKRNLVLQERKKAFARAGKPVGWDTCDGGRSWRTRIGLVLSTLSESIGSMR